MEKANLKDLIAVSDMVNEIICDIEKAKLMVGDIVQDYLNGKGDENRTVLEQFRNQYATRGAIAEEYLSSALEKSEILQISLTEKIRSERNTEAEQ